MIDTLSIYLTLISNILVAISVLFLWFQIKEMKKQIQSSTYQTIVQMFDNFSLIMLQNPHLSQYIFDNTSSIEQSQIEWALAIRFDWFESVVIQRHRYSAIPIDIYDHWINILGYELSNPHIMTFWRRYGNLYHPLFQKEVSRLICSDENQDTKEYRVLLYQIRGAGQDHYTQESLATGNKRYTSSGGTQSEQ